MIYRLLIVFTMWLIPVCASGQIRALRNSIFPTSDSTVAQGFLNRFGGMIDIQRGYGSPENYLAWLYKIAAYAELYRGDDWSIGFAHANELMANPYSPIGFNPRAVVWEENIFVAWQMQDWTLRAGVVHRCKHEIDDSEPDDFAHIPMGFTPERRVIIVTGAEVAAILRGVTVLGFSGTLSGSIAAYPSARDYRERGFDTLSDSLYTSPDMRKAIGAVAAGAIFKRTIAGQAAIYGRFFGEAIPMNSLEWNGRGELGVMLTGHAGTLCGFLSAERMYDDFSSLVPRPASVYSFGLRFSGGGFE